MSTGNIVEVIGAVVDVEFPRDAVPKIYDALLIAEAEGLTLEVQQQLGDGIVRTIAMGAAEGLRRGYDKMSQDVRRASTDLDHYVRQNPGKSLLIATAVGFVVGLLVSRRQDR